MNSQTRKVLTEIHRQINIIPYSAWRLKYRDLLIGHRDRYNGNLTVKVPTLTKLGYSFSKMIVEEPIAYKHTNKTYKFINTEIVRYVLTKQEISGIKEVIYQIRKFKDQRRKSVQLYYR